MFISSIRIENYRTFRQLELAFDSRANYIVGDNNIGKSNLLFLLKTITHGYGFRECDFLNPNLPIRVLISLSDADEGFDGTLSIEVLQTIKEIVPHLYNARTKEEMPLEYLRSLLCVSFELQDVPRRMLSNGMDRRILNLFYDFFAANPSTYERAEALLKDCGISVSFPREPQKASILLFREIFGEESRGMSYDNTMKFVVALGARLMATLVARKNSKAISFDQMVNNRPDGSRVLPIMVSVDEPELHLHPYMQRAVLAFLTAVLNNEEPFFLELVHQMLGVDGLDGQIFVVTHSTDSLINDYRQIIRMYWDEEKKVQAACGVLFHFDREVEKHLIMHFPEVKEALYSRTAILVEGETEYGSFGYFAKTLGIHFDFYGICLINARGESSIQKISKLLHYFHIPTVSLYDRDVMSGMKEGKYTFFTDEICFEMDVVKSCLDHGNREILDEVIGSSEGPSDLVNASLVKKAGAKLGLPKGYYPPTKLKNINPRNREALDFYYFAWLYGNKGVIIGRTLGEKLSARLIPPAFVKVIREAVKISTKK